MGEETFVLVLLCLVEKPKAGINKRVPVSGSGSVTLLRGSGGAASLVPALSEVAHRLRAASCVTQSWKRRLIKGFQGRAVTQQDTHAFK